MIDPHRTLARIQAHAKRHRIKPQHVVRKATGDPRGWDRLRRKVEQVWITVETLEAWMDGNNVSIGTQDAADASRDQVVQKSKVAVRSENGAQS